jgi:hypothetical protein
MHSRHHRTSELITTQQLISQAWVRFANPPNHALASFRNLHSHPPFPSPPSLLGAIKVLSTLIREYEARLMKECSGGQRFKVLAAKRFVARR